MRVFAASFLFPLLLVIPPGVSAQGKILADRLELGQKGDISSLDAKVVQVIDEYQMLVGLEANATGRGRYNIIVWMKCSTKGLTDGKFWNKNEWERRTGSRYWEVTDTKTYKLASGGTKTVFVLEHWKDKK